MTETVPTSAYGMHYDAANADIIARAQSASEDEWNALPVDILPARTPLNASLERVTRRDIERVVRGDVELRGADYPTKLWRDGDEKLYVVDGHVRAAIHFALNKAMPVRMMYAKARDRPPPT